MRFEEEDFERAHLKDQMYLEEYQREIEADYQQWKEQQPARIVILTPFKNNKNGRRKYINKILQGRSRYTDKSRKS